MDVKKLTLGMVGIMICAVMIGGALLPAVGSVLDDERTIVNNAIFSSNYAIIEDPIKDDLSLDMSYTYGNNTATVNEKTIPIGQYNSFLVISDVCLVQVGLASGNNRVAGVGDTTITILDNTYTSVNVTVTGSTISVEVNGTNPIEKTYTDAKWIAYADNDGNYKLMNRGNGGGTDTVYVNDISQIYGATTISVNNLGWSSFKGDTLTVGDNTYKMALTSQSTQYEDVISFINGDGYHVDPNEFTNPGNSLVTPYYFLIPDKIIGHTEQQAVISSLFNVVPLVAIAGLVMAGIYVFISRK